MAQTMARATLETIGFLAMLAIALFAPAQSIAWPAAWAVLLFFLLFSVAGLLLLDPGLIEERSSLPPEIKLGDILLAGTAFIFIYPATMIVSGFDFRFGWSLVIPVLIREVAFLVLVLGYGFSLWAARTNRFFSTVVRIQGERGHHVIDTGPYAFIRHPGYAGPLVAHACLPIVLGTVAALVPTIIGAAFLLLRAVREEQMLVTDLPGYRDYTARVRWRILPGLW